MKNITSRQTGFTLPAISIGCMRIAGKSDSEMNSFIHTALENGACFFDHADIYAGGKSEELFGKALAEDKTIQREDLILQTKCGIRAGCYDLSREYILASVDQSLKRLHTDYLDILLLHRPDALVEPEEVAEAFDLLKTSGKVRHFGVSNHKPSQIALLQKYANVPIEFNQMQLSIPVSNMIAQGMEVNMETPGSVDHDNSILDYCRLKDIVLQAWSPVQMPAWKGCFIGSEDYPKLNKVLDELAEKYGVTPTTISIAWILRHPAGIQVVTGTSNEGRLKEMIAACDVTLSRQEWYRLYLAAGHILP